MKTIVIALIFYLLIVFVPQWANAAEMPDINVDVKILQNLQTGKLFVAEGPGVTVATALDKVIRFNIETAFPDGNQVEADFIAGPMIKIDFIKLLSKTGKVEIIQGVNLEGGLGVMLDVFHIEGLDLKDWRKVTYPGGAIGFRF